MPSAKLSQVPPVGLSFEVSDLLLMEAWAEFHKLRMGIALDYCAGGDEYEEVLEFYPRGGAFRRWMMWRVAAGIVVQPLIGRPKRFATVAEALEKLIPAHT